MVKKPANRAKNISFGRIEVDPGIADKLDHAAKIERALKDNKQFRTARTDGKRKRQANNAEARKQFGHKPKIRVSEDEFIHTLRNIERELKRAESPFAAAREVVRCKAKSTNELYDTEWNHEAHTGVVGKRPEQIPRSDVRYRSYPFTPKR